jgi:hypothetical protein
MEEDEEDWNYRVMPVPSQTMTEPTKPSAIMGQEVKTEEHHRTAYPYQPRTRLSPHSVRMPSLKTTKVLESKVSEHCQTTKTSPT